MIIVSVSRQTVMGSHVDAVANGCHIETNTKSNVFGVL